MQSYYYKNQDRLLKYQKEYYKKNKEQISDKMRTYFKTYYDKNKDKIIEKNRKYIKKCREEDLKLLKERYKLYKMNSTTRNKDIKIDPKMINFILDFD